MIFIKDEKTKQKEEKLIEMVNSFCKEHLNDEYANLSVKLIEKLGRKHDIPFKRGKLENWASGVIYAIAQINFLFDKSQNLHTSPDEICDFFNTKKSTASNKARDIRDMFNMGHFDEEFSSKSILDNAPRNFLDLNSGFIISEEFIDSNSMDDFFDEVYSLYENNQSDEALKLLDTIPKDNPEYSRALFYKSVILSDEDGANDFELFQKALFNEMRNNLNASDLEYDFDSNNPHDLFDEGVFNFEIEDFDDAIEFFDLAIELKPDYEEAFYYKSLSLAGLDNFKEALNVINKAIKLNSNNDQLWNDKANFLVKLNRFDEAYECFDRAIELNPTDFIIWSNKAFTYLENEKYDDALKCYDKACELDEFEIHPILGKANVYLALQDFDNAQKCYDLACEIDDEDIEFLTEYGHFLLIQEKFHEAIDQWDKCLKQDEELASVWIFKAMAYVGLNNDDLVNKCLHKAFEIDPMMVYSLDELFDYE